MISDPVVQWILTLVFTATGAHSALRLIVDRRFLLLVSNLLHLIMSVVMVAMCWPWWSLIPAMPQLYLFGVGVIWFLAIAVLQISGRLSRTDASAGHGAWHQLAHALMMFAMVWMIVMMLPGSADGEAHTHGHQHGGGHGHDHGHQRVHAHDHAQVHAHDHTHHDYEFDFWETLIGWGLVAGLLAVGVMFLLELLAQLKNKKATPKSAADIGSGAAMSLGMAGACWLMIVG